MATVAIHVDVSYSQLAIFWSSLSQPFNDWEQMHVDQGFAWRIGSVSFRTLTEFGAHSIEVNVVDYFQSVSPDAVRVIDVPFKIPADGDIEVASISDSAPLSLPSGSYCLRCEQFGSSNLDGYKVVLTFARAEDQTFAVIRADNDLIIKEGLLTTAEPAVI